MIIIAVAKNEKLYSSWTIENVDINDSDRCMTGWKKLFTYVVRRALHKEFYINNSLLLCCNTTRVGEVQCVHSRGGGAGLKLYGQLKNKINKTGYARTSGGFLLWLWACGPPPTCLYFMDPNVYLNFCFSLYNVLRLYIWTTRQGLQSSSYSIHMCDSTHSLAKLSYVIVIWNAIGWYRYIYFGLTMYNDKGFFLYCDYCSVYCDYGR